MNQLLKQLFTAQGIARLKVPQSFVFLRTSGYTYVCFKARSLNSCVGFALGPLWAVLLRLALVSQSERPLGSGYKSGFFKGSELSFSRFVNYRGLICFNKNYFGVSGLLCDELRNRKC